MRRALIALLASALLLSACGAEPEPTPEPTSAGPSVAVHWDALEEKQEPIVKRRCEEYTPELIPAGDYGPLVPYIGGETEQEYGESSLFYGLATREGVIVTDPVYTEVERLVWYDYDLTYNFYADVLVLRSVAERDGQTGGDLYGSLNFEDRYGLAALDGSWYTGQIYRSVISQGPYGALCMETGGDVVMLDMEGGERFRWSAEALPLRNLAENAADWEPFATYGKWLIYTPDWMTDADAVQYADLTTGETFDTKPEGLNWPVDYDGRDPSLYIYDGGEYSFDARTVTVLPDGGAEVRFEVPDSVGSFTYVEINADRALVYGMDGCTLLDFEGNILQSWDSTVGFFYSNSDTPPLLSCHTYPGYDPSTDFSFPDPLTTVYSRDGVQIMEVDGSVTQFDDRLVFTDGEYYCVSDLEGNVLLRLSRWAKMDTPAE